RSRRTLLSRGRALAAIAHDDHFAVNAAAAAVIIADAVLARDRLDHIAAQQIADLFAVLERDHPGALQAEHAFAKARELVLRPRRVRGAGAVEIWRIEKEKRLRKIVRVENGLPWAILDR